MPSSNTPFTLLVNSCDAFDDCWAPFFTLLRKYWPGELPPILLNTEHKDYSLPGVPLTATQVQAGVSERLTWSQCLDAALAQIETPLVLYMQEDYFIERPVDIEAVTRAAQLMLERPEIQHIGLTHFGSGGPFTQWEELGLSQIRRGASYRISTQAGLWRTPTLRSYILPWESGWMFELFGTVRSWRRNELFLTVDRDTAERPPIAYQHTGIVKGQWSDFVPPLFEREGIAMDFSRRGFYLSPPPLVRRMKLARSIANKPGLALRSLLSQ